MSAYTVPQGPINAVVRDRTSLKFSVIDITNYRLIDLFGLYRLIEVPAIDSYGAEVTIELSAHYRTALLNSTLTYSEWLVANGDNALITKAGYPVLDTAPVNRIAGLYNKGTYTLAKAGWHPSNEASIDDLTDLIVDFEGVDSRGLFEHSLWSVNGYYLPSSYQDYGVRVKHAGEIMRRSGKVQFSLLNFENVGKVTLSPIQEHQISKVDDSKSYYERLIIGTDFDLFGKTVGIVIGGYLHLLDNFVNVISNNSISLSMRNFNYLDKILESKDDLVLDFMELDNVEDSAVVSHVLNDENIKRYLSSKYSFLVIIDNADLYREQIGADHRTGLGKLKVSDIDTVSVVQDRNGKGLEYWPTESAGEWILNYDDYTVNRYLAQTTNWESLVYINDARQPSKPVEDNHFNLYSIIARI